MAKTKIAVLFGGKSGEHDISCISATSVIKAIDKEKYDIITVPGHLVFPGNKEIKAFLDWETVPRDEFYADLKKKPDEYKRLPDLPTTMCICHLNLSPDTEARF